MLPVGMLYSSRGDAWADRTPDAAAFPVLKHRTRASPSARRGGASTYVLLGEIAPAPRCECGACGEWDLGRICGTFLTLNRKCDIGDICTSGSHSKLGRQAVFPLGSRAHPEAAGWVIAASAEARARRECGLAWRTALRAPPPSAARRGPAAGIFSLSENGLWPRGALAPRGQSQRGDRPALRRW